MTIREMPNVSFGRPRGYRYEVHSGALGRWQPRAAEADNPATVSIYDVIGEDWWSGEGVTAKRVAGALRSIGGAPVTVNINSPGGDMFEGLAIYNLLREHPAEVTVKVMGLAASAASIIAMAGDRVEMGLGSFLMIHYSWGLVVGNQDDMRSAAETFAEFDAAMADIYVARTGLPFDEVSNLMASETWFRAEAAIESGFADATFDAPPEKKSADAGKMARAALEAALQKAGVPRFERRRLMREAAGMPGAAGTAMPGAGFDRGAAVRLIQTIKA